MTTSPALTARKFAAPLAVCLIVLSACTSITLGELRGDLNSLNSARVAAPKPDSPLDVMQGQSLQEQYGALSAKSVKKAADLDGPDKVFALYIATVASYYAQDSSLVTVANNALDACQKSAVKQPAQCMTVRATQAMGAIAQLQTLTKKNAAAHPGIGWAATMNTPAYAGGAYYTKEYDPVVTVTVNFIESYPSVASNNELSEAFKDAYKERVVSACQVTVGQGGHFLRAYGSNYEIGGTQLGTKVNTEIDRLQAAMKQSFGANPPACGS